MVTISVIKADIGGWVGHSGVHPDLLEAAQSVLEEGRKRGVLLDYYVTYCGDDVNLIMTHDRGNENPEVHGLAWEAFQRATEVAKSLKLYGAGQDLLADAFSGNVRGMGPGVAEMTIEERKSEPIIVFMGDKTSPGAWNLPLFRIFADPFNTAGLVIAPSLHQGFRFEIHDIQESKRIFLDAPEEMYDILAFIGAPERYNIKAVYSRATGEIAAVSSTERLAQVAGRYVGKDDPVMIVRCQSQFPAVGEVLEPFTFPHLVPGWMRGSHMGPIMPVSLKQARTARFDGPPRVVALGFQVSEGRLIGPVDMFDNPAFDEARRMANQVADYMRRHGPFEPHRLPLEEMEYTTLPDILKRLASRMEDLDGQTPTPEKALGAMPEMDVD